MTMLPTRCRRRMRKKPVETKSKSPAASLHIVPEMDDAELAESKLAAFDGDEEPAERVLHIQEMLQEAEQDFCPAGSIGPEIELVFDESTHPFQEPFQDEEVIAERYPTTARAPDRPTAAAPTPVAPPQGTTSWPDPYPEDNPPPMRTAPSQNQFQAAFDAPAARAAARNFVLARSVSRRQPAADGNAFAGSVGGGDQEERAPNTRACAARCGKRRCSDERSPGSRRCRAVPQAGRNKSPATPRKRRRANRHSRSAS